MGENRYHRWVVQRNRTPKQGENRTNTGKELGRGRMFLDLFRKGDTVSNNFSVPEHLEEWPSLVIKEVPWGLRTRSSRTVRIVRI